MRTHCRDSSDDEWPQAQPKSQHRAKFSGDDVAVQEKTVLRAFLNITASIAGCQATRLKIDHCCFGFQVVHGECIFLTVSPNRRHSSMILSRARRNDVSLLSSDEVYQWRSKFAAKTSHASSPAKASLKIPRVQRWWWKLISQKVNTPRFEFPGSLFALLPLLVHCASHSACHPWDSHVLELSGLQ